MQSKIVRINCQLQLKANEFCSLSLQSLLSLSPSAYLSFVGLSIVYVCGRVAAQVGVALCLESKTLKSNCAQQLEIKGKKEEQQEGEQKRK